ncbi:hypothetical protein IFM89_030791 [Coptis chinensis]|uniref:E3 ubiquitin ligase UBR4 C-terminal domain-containing protein n=1 Tax=Coptis chinensis TaxID=261450 RepID=A0A835IHL5_9MAGN|nr:hypothetical protein IFM89_030791 [Coptis chinensis]
MVFEVKKYRFNLIDCKYDFGLMEKWFTDSKAIHSYAKQVVELDQLLRRMVFESLSVMMTTLNLATMSSMFTSTLYLTILMKLRLVPDHPNETKVGVEAHTDMELNDNNTISQNFKGLEVETKDGHWIQVKLSPNSFIVKTNDAFVGGLAGLAAVTVGLTTNAAQHLEFKGNNNELDCENGMKDDVGIIEANLCQRVGLYSTMVSRLGGLPGRQSGAKEWRITRSEWGFDEDDSYNCSSCPVHGCVDEHVSCIYRSFYPLFSQFIDKGLANSDISTILGGVKRCGCCNSIVTMVTMWWVLILLRLWVVDGLVELAVASSAKSQKMKLGFELNPVLGSALVDFYSKCGCFAEAFEILNPKRGASISSSISQGFILHKLIELLSKFLEIPNIRSRFMRVDLLSEVLEALLVIRGLIVQKTKLISDCNKLLKDLLVLNKAHTQEEFIRGPMTKNPYSSAEIGPLMRDVKNKICHQLDLLGLLEDDYGMELLVAGNIISLDLSISQVYELVWKKSNNQSPSTTVNSTLISSNSFTRDAHQ